MAQDKVQNTSAVIKQVNVTDLTPRQKHELFASHITKAGFTSFTIKKVGNQTYYTFTYKN